MNTKSKLKRALEKRYRVIIYHDKTYQKLGGFRCSKMNLITWISIFILLIAGISYTLIAYTPIKTIIPGYPNTNIKEQIAHNSMQLDSLEFELQLKDQYIQNVKHIITGDTLNNNFHDRYKDSVKRYDNITFTPSNYDSLLKQEIANRNNYQPGFATNPSNNNKFNHFHFYKPLGGVITSAFNRKKKHFGVDIVSAPNKVVSAVMGGTVTMATWSVETGHVIQIQHPHNLMSVYKHNARLLKEEGEYVRAGEAISVVGNSGELTTGPHLHFELWYKGKPLDPEDYITF